MREFEAVLPRIRARLDLLNPPPLGPLPLLIAGFGEQVMLRLVAQHADIWNCAGSPEQVAHKNGVRDGWCRRVGRDPSQIERAVLLFPEAVPRWREYVDAGFQHLILAAAGPFDLAPARQVLEGVRAA